MTTPIYELLKAKADQAAIDARQMRDAASGVVDPNERAYAESQCLAAEKRARRLSLDARAAYRRPQRRG